MMEEIKRQIAESNRRALAVSRPLVSNVDTFAIYDGEGNGIDTIEAASEVDAHDAYCVKNNLSTLPEGWWVESVYA